MSCRVFYALAACILACPSVAAQFLTKIVKIGEKPLSVGAGGGVYAESPDVGPSWKLRIALTLLFPT